MARNKRSHQEPAPHLHIHCEHPVCKFSRDSFVLGVIWQQEGPVCDRMAVIRHLPIRAVLPHPRVSWQGPANMLHGSKQGGIPALYVMHEALAVYEN